MERTRIRHEIALPGFTNLPGRREHEYIQCLQHKSSGGAKVPHVGSAHTSRLKRIVPHGVRVHGLRRLIASVARDRQGMISESSRNPPASRMPAPMANLGRLPQWPRPPLHHQHHQGMGQILPGAGSAALPIISDISENAFALFARRALTSIGAHVFLQLSRDLLGSLSL